MAVCGRMAAAHIPWHAVLKRVARFLLRTVTQGSRDAGKGAPVAQLPHLYPCLTLVPCGLDGLDPSLPLFASAESLSWVCHAVGQGVGGAAHGRCRAGGEHVQPLTTARADSHAIGKKIPQRAQTLHALLRR